jgi:hypothetical protein
LHSLVASAGQCGRVRWPFSELHHTLELRSIQSQFRLAKNIESGRLASHVHTPADPLSCRCFARHRQQLSSIRRGGDAVRSLLHRLRSWVRMETLCSEAHLPLRFGPMPLHEKPLDSADALLYTGISLAIDYEYGIASNAVTVLRPDLVESVCAIDPELAITFPKLDSGQTLSPFKRSPPKVHYPPKSAAHHRPHFPLQLSNSLYLSLTTVAAYFHSLITGSVSKIEESWLFS